MHFCNALATLGLLLLPCNARVVFRSPPAPRSLNPALHSRWQQVNQQAICTIIDEPYYEPGSVESVLNDLPDYNETNKEEVIQQLLLSNPNITLWTIFIGRTKQIGDKLDHEKNKPLAVTKEVIHIEEEINLHLIQYVADVAKFGVKLIFEPESSWKAVGKWFKDFGKGIGSWVSMLWTKPPQYSAEQTFGGMMLAIIDDPGAFIAETALLVTGGFAAIHGFMEGVAALAGTLPLTVQRVLFSILIFIHCLDDPILILAPILQTTVQGTSLANIDGVANGTTIGSGTIHSHNETLYDRNGTAYGQNHTVELTSLPAGADLQSFLPTLPTCLLPPTSPAYQLQYEDFCNKTSGDLAHIIFGVYDRRNLTKVQMTEAWAKFQDFTCCYGPEKLNLQLNSTMSFEGSTVTGSFNCTKLYGKY